MGGQACVFYGAAQFSKDVDFVLLAEAENYARLQAALTELDAGRIAVPPFDPAVLARGHAVHFSCRGGPANGLRVDVMTRLRDLPDFAELWQRRTTLTDENGQVFELMALEDLVQAKKTQCDKDWPMIDALVEGHYRALGNETTPAREVLADGIPDARTIDRVGEPLSPSSGRVGDAPAPVAAGADR